MHCALACLSLSIFFLSSFLKIGIATYSYAWNTNLSFVSHHMLHVSIKEASVIIVLHY